MVSKKPTTKGKDKANVRWAEGVWFGVRDESGEHIVATNKGVLKVRAIRRRGSQQDRWNWEEFKKVVGLPWEPIPGRPEIEMTSRIEDGMQNRPVQEPTIGEDRDAVKREFRIHKGDVREHGPTPHCK